MKTAVCSGWASGNARIFLSVFVAVICSALVLAGCGGGNTCTLTINVNLEGAGTVSRKPNKTSFAPGKKVTITAIPVDGYKFVEWTVTVGQAQFTNANNATTTITLGANPTTTIVATFRLDQFNSQIKYDSFKDLRDGHSYRTVRIGNITWMAENLNFEMKSSRCGGVNAVNGLQYGRFYNWDDAKNACPAGWLLPTRQDWHNLIQAVGGEQIAGKNLKSGRGWRIGGNGTDQFGFSAIPGNDAGEISSWWSATSSPLTLMRGIIVDEIYSQSIAWNSDSVVRNRLGGQQQVRCIQLDKEQMAAREQERQRELQRQEQERQQEQQRQEQERQHRLEQQRLQNERYEQQRQQQLENQRLQRERQEQQRQQRFEEQRLQRERQQQQRQQRR